MVGLRVSLGLLKDGLEFMQVLFKVFSRQFKIQGWFVVCLGVIQALGWLKGYLDLCRVGEVMFMVYLGFIQGWLRIYLGLVCGLFICYLRFIEGSFMVSLEAVEGLLRVGCGSVQGLFVVDLGLVQVSFKGRYVLFKTYLGLV